MNPMDIPVRIGLLGEPEVVLGGKPVALNQPLQRAVLAVLAVRSPQPVTRSGLVGAIWGEDQAPANADGSVHTYISVLRNVLEPGRTPRTHGTVLVTTPSGYALRLPPGSIDIDQFSEHRNRARQLREAGDSASAARELRSALRLWRGTALSGVPGPFAESQRLRLTEAKIAALAEWSDAELEGGQPADVVAELSSAVAEHPLHERLTCQLMLAFYRCGRQADALLAFHNARRALADELGVDPGPELRRVYDQILNSDRALLRSAQEPSSPGYVKPRQMPHDVPGFVGREKELDQLCGRLVPSSDRDARPLIITAIDGAGGIGKTTLAIHAVQNVAQEFPDGQLYINLNGCDPTHTPVEPTNALAHLLHGLGVEPARLPETTTERASLYRSVLAGRKVLILLDNAVDSDQVRPLMPGTSTCRVMVTSRNRLSGLVATDGAHRITLDVLSDTDALELLRRGVGDQRVASEPDAARELVRLCGHLPLALRIVAERAAAHPHHTMADFAQDLADEHNRLDLLEADQTTAVRATFSWSYQALDPDTARMFRLLGLHPGIEISLAAAAALNGTPLAPARHLVEQLCTRHLLEEQGHRRYRFHDLIRTYAAERAMHDESPRERDAAVDRILHWYLQTASNAAQTIPARGMRLFTLPELPDGCCPAEFRSYEEAMAWLETERANLISAVRQASAGDHKDLAWKIALIARNFYRLKTYFDDFMAVGQIGLAAARELGDRDAEAAMYYSIGSAHSMLMNYDEARPWLERSLHLWRSTGNKKGESIALFQIAGSYYHHKDRWPEAEECLLRAREIAITASQPALAIRITANLGEVNRMMGRFDKAIEYLTEVLVATNDPDAALMKATASRYLGETYMDTGELGKALDHCRQALAIFDRYGYESAKAYVLVRIARILHEQGDADEASAAALGALKIFDELHDHLKEFRGEMISILQSGRVEYLPCG